jgi:hypothetical protein
MSLNMLEFQISIEGQSLNSKTMRTLATKQPINDVAKQKNGERGRSHSISPLSTGMLLQRQCACGGGCPRCQDELGIQTKLKIGEPGDKYEQQADSLSETLRDRITDEVMRMPEPQQSPNHPTLPQIEQTVQPISLLQRFDFPWPFNGYVINNSSEPVTAGCNSLEIPNAELDAGVPHDAGVPLPGGILNRKISHVKNSADNADYPTEVPPIVYEVLNSPGQPLDSSTRNDFEQRFGHDFANVEVHTGARAAVAAAAVNASAYTVGNHIVFGSGYEPSHHEASRRLLAHELVHIIQQRNMPYAPVLARQFHTRTFQERSGGGTTDFIETVQNAPTRNGSIISGTVDRSEVAPASGSTPQQTIHTGSVNVQFDTSTCTLTVPYKFDFNQTLTVNPPFCQDPPNTTAVQPLPAQEFQTLRTRYIQYVNDGLNGLFTARITGCQQPCIDRAIPIRIDARDDPSSPDRVMNVVNRSGRGNAGTICVGGMERRFAVHESGHQILGLGDEYRESDPTLRQQIPEWGRDERVRTDLTYMGSDSQYGRFSLFHQRHFRFAQVFLESAFPGCTITLEEVSRPMPDFRLSFDLGYARISGGNAFTTGIGFDVGLPLTRLREAELLLGVRGRYFLEMAGQNRTALLAGVQVGLEGRTSPGGVAATFGLLSGGGLYHQFASRRYGLPPVPERTSAFLEGGGSIGITTGMIGGGRSLSARLEAAGGGELLDSPDAMRWFRLGLRLGGEF